TRSIQTRLLLEDLSRLPAMSSVEIYRLFCASQQNMKFRSLPEIINSVVLYGDILLWQEAELHPMTRSLLQDLTAGCRHFFDQLATTEPHKIVQLGIDWVRTVCICLAKYLPEADEKEKQLETSEESDIPNFVR